VALVRPVNGQVRRARILDEVPVEAVEVTRLVERHPRDELGCTHTLLRLGLECGYNGEVLQAELACG